MKLLKFIFVITVLFLTGAACSFSASTARITDAKMAKDSEGTQVTNTFAPEDTFYCLVTLENAPDDTRVKAVWTAVEVQDNEPNVELDQAELETGDGVLTFDLSNDNLWPAGRYKVELYVNDELKQTVEFQVQ